MAALVPASTSSAGALAGRFCCPPILHKRVHCISKPSTSPPSRDPARPPAGSSNGSCTALPQTDPHASLTDLARTLTHISILSSICSRKLALSLIKSGSRVKRSRPDTEKRRASNAGACRSPQPAVNLTRRRLSTRAAPGTTRRTSSSRPASLSTSKCLGSEGGILKRCASTN